MKRISHISRLVMFALAIVVSFTGCRQGKYQYETVEGDPMNTKMYTLPNGLKVFMTVNKEQPRIQTCIAVHAGSKHEPTETTGLAHYLEHMMFKGTENFGTVNYEAEKAELDKIRDLYEVYRKTTDEEQRKAIYHSIDSISYVASTYFIPNEYDKVMSHIGSEGSNAYTSNDETVYVEDIPSNEIENWAKVQSDRFKNMVLRGFHTELETVYEEYNRALNNDVRKIFDVTAKTLMPTHPYNHSVIGYGEHLKNPSIKNIEDFFHTYYVPNNMAICLSGDFDPDYMVDVLVKYFGDMQPNPNLKMPEIEPQPALTRHVDNEILSPGAEDLVMAWRFDGAASHQNDTLDILSEVLYNGKAGLFDLDLNLSQAVLGANSFAMHNCDYSILYMSGSPLPGQSLEAIRDLMLAEVDKLRRGDFSEDLIKAIITEEKLQMQRDLESNSDRASMYVDAFVNDIDWADQVGRIARLERISKQDVVDFANRHMGDNYSCVFKRVGEDSSASPVAKPAITPIQMNRDTVSAFAMEILSSEVEPIEPVFVNLQKDIDRQTVKGLPLLYRHNTLNDLFNLTFRYEMGEASEDGKYLSLAADYLEYLGTDSLTAQQIQQQFHQLGCSMSLRVGQTVTTLQLSGLQENMRQALLLMQHVVECAKSDSLTMDKFVATVLKSHGDVLQTFNLYTPYSVTMLKHGPSRAGLFRLTDNEVAGADGDSLVGRIHQLPHYEHRVTYYGPMEESEILSVLGEVLFVPEALKPVPSLKDISLSPVEEDQCYVVPFKSTKSFVMNQFACNGSGWDAEKLGVSRMFTEYFGGGMNSIVFQEMREKRSLCYQAYSIYRMPESDERHCYVHSGIQSQNDKMKECIDAFGELYSDMPQSETSFNVCKQGLITQLRTQRTTGTGYFDKFFTAERLGIDYDTDSLLFEQVQTLGLQDIVDFKQQYMDGLHYRSIVIGDPASLDRSQLERLGKVVTVEPAKAFGFQ
ncbi:insulinase family protein [bacterium]|nr:insulinase family protein [bacterium]